MRQAATRMVARPCARDTLALEQNLAHRQETRSFSPLSYLTIKETISKATMLMTLIIGLIAGPAVSL